MLLTSLVILTFCCVITGIYMYFVHQQIEDSERSDS